MADEEHDEQYDEAENTNPDQEEAESDPD